MGFLKLLFTLPFLFLLGCEFSDNLLGDNPSIDPSHAPPAASTGSAVTLVLNGGSYEFSDGTFAATCLEYLEVSEGDALYTINPSGSPLTVHCDMTTDGGGWTLVGRGREGWAWSEAGTLNSQVHTNIGTVSAFAPAYYSSAVIDGITGAAVSNLVDGVRIKRVTNPTGTAFQEVRWHFTSLTNWSWLFDTTFALSQVEINGANFGANDTRDSFEDGNNFNRIFTWAWSGHASVRGFSFGSTVTAGTNSATNFMWENGTERHSIPYTEVYVRQ